MIACFVCLVTKSLHFFGVPSELVCSVCLLCTPANQSFFCFSCEGFKIHTKNSSGRGISFTQFCLSNFCEHQSEEPNHHARGQINKCSQCSVHRQCQQICKARSKWDWDRWSTLQRWTTMSFNATSKVSVIGHAWWSFRLVSTTI